MPITSIIRGLGGFGSKSDIYGKKVQVPSYPELIEAQEKALRANRDVLPGVEAFAEEANDFNAKEIEDLLRFTIEDLPEINTNISKSLAAWTRGDIGPTADIISRKTAERAVAGGFSGSGMHRNLEARDLGLTSLQLTQQGMTSAERWIASARNHQHQLMDVSAMFLTPQQQYAAMQSKWQADLYAATMAAAPDPQARGAFDSEMALIGMALSAYGGGPGYTGTYQQQAAPPPQTQRQEWGKSWWQETKADWYTQPDYSAPNGGWMDADKRGFV